MFHPLKRGKKQMVTLQEFGDVEENVLNPDSHSVPESVKQEAEQL